MEHELERGFQRFWFAFYVQMSCSVDELLLIRDELLAITQRSN
jgi:hypothetical protein